MHLGDGTVINQAISESDPGHISLQEGGALEPQRFALVDVLAINPVKPEVKWTGSIAGGGVITTGNSDTQSANIDIEAIRRAEHDRITLGAGWLYGRQKNQDTDDFVTTTNKWFVLGQYDYFFTKKFYGYAAIKAEQDKIANLDLRLLPGVGVGYQWIETPDMNFRTEAGLAWMYEKYRNESGSESSIAARLAYHFDKRLWDRVDFFHNLELYPSLEDFSDIILTTDAGIRTALIKALFAEFKVQMDYDSTPAEGADSTDMRYILNLGWNF